VEEGAGAMNDAQSVSVSVVDSIRGVLPTVDHADCLSQLGTTTKRKMALLPTNETPASKSHQRGASEAQNFLLVGAKKAKEMRSARSAARVGIVHSKKAKVSHTGSQVPMTHVIRLKFVKGFTQAVRAPCKIDDLL
jgi:hypothetical protein